MSSRSYTRRQLLRMTGGAALTLGSARLLVACGGSGGGDPVPDGGGVDGGAGDGAGAASDGLGLDGPYGFEDCRLLGYGRIFDGTGYVPVGAYYCADYEPGAYYCQAYDPTSYVCYFY